MALCNIPRLAISGTPFANTSHTSTTNIIFGIPTTYTYYSCTLQHMYTNKQINLKSTILIDLKLNLNEIKLNKIKIK